MAETEFELYRGLLFSIAYRMTGSAADAEDLVQDAYVRFASADSEVVRDVKAFLVTILTRLALDRLKSAQVQRETYIGPWLPEPVFTGNDADPYARVAREEKIEFALLAALERLSPQERAVLLLHEVLDYDHNEIAELLGITSAASRQQLHRARERVSEGKPRFTPSNEEQRRLIDGFMAALVKGDVDGLRNVLASDVVVRSDGGGKAFAAKRPIVGFDDVSRFYFGLTKQLAKFPDAVIDVEEVNGAPALVGSFPDRVQTVMTFVVRDGKIAEILAVLNPDKLRFFERQTGKGAGHS